MRDGMSDAPKNKQLGRWEQIEVFLKSHEFIQNADVRLLCGVPVATANRILAGFAAEDRLVKCRKDEHWAYSQNENSTYKCNK